MLLLVYILMVGGHVHVNSMLKKIFLSILIIFTTSLMGGMVHADITIDGVLDEPAWETATVFREFVTVEPLTGSAAKYPTEVRMMTTSEGIFIGFVNYQPASVKRVDRRFPRDAKIEADRNVVSIDFDGTAVSAYDFTVGSTNSRQDGVIGSGTYSGDWDGIWYSQTSSEEDYWYSEIHIPWTVAPMSSSAEGIKKMAVWFSRVVYNESLRFAFPNAFYTRNTFLEDWHKVEVIQVDTSTLDWFPYVSYNKNLHANNDLAMEDDFNTGLDIIWRPNSNTQLTGAINPDFGQVESDDLVVNFSAFETFVTEKRPFFTENQGLFNSQIPNEDRLLYTRRIGAGDVGGNGGLVDINAAGKLTYFGKNVDMGLFVVSEDDAEGAAAGDFLSSRIQRKVGNVAFGHRLTHSKRAFLGREATVQMVDVDWQYSDSVQFMGQILHSNIDQKANSDMAVLSSVSNDYAAWANWSYAPSDEWQYILYLSHYGDEFDMNDLGYMKRNNFNELYASSRHDRLQYDDSSSLLSSYVSIEYGHSETTEGRRLESWVNTEISWTFRSTRQLSLDLGLQASGWDDRITRGNGLFAKPKQQWGSAIYKSPRGDNYVYGAKLFFESDGGGKLSSGVTYEPQLYLSDRLTLGGEITFKDYREWLIWDAEFQQLATYEAHSYYMDLRLDWYPSLRQEVRLKFQWVGIDAKLLASYVLDGSGDVEQSAIQSENFSISDTAFQLRYRYQLAPLSDVFLVYSRGGFYGSTDGNEGPSNLFDQGWDGLQVESLIAKIRYRFH
jgi:hypothetical protein